VPKSENGDFDLVVVGGGPGGSTLSAFVAMQGHRVLLLEKESFPRHQIGESLLPATIHGICPLLGVSEEIRKANFTRKLGGTFLWGRNKKPWTFYFSLSPQLPGPTAFAYQVERSNFDSILLENARKKGVVVRENSPVTDVLLDGERVAGVRYVDAAGESHAVTSRYVADASGNLSRIYENVGQRVYSQFFQNVALYGYYRGGKRLASPNDGNILCAAFDGGWFWYIPLSDTLTSVGVVIARERASEIRKGPEEAMRQFIAACPLIAEYLENAERLTEGPYGQLRIRRDYSYCSTRFWRPGMMLVGDAACFVDPVFSSGVHLSTYSALLAARSINSCLRDDLDERRAFTEFELRYRREFGNFYQFLAAFYDASQDEQSYFWSARKILSSSEKANEAFIRLVAGVGSSGEPMWGDSERFFRAMSSIGDSFRRASDQQQEGREFDQSKLDKVFMEGFNREIAQIQAQALTGTVIRASPLWEGGLVPTADGLHWRVPPEVSAASGAGRS
jgi:halogenation protein CepH